ncbi:NAD(P)H dehydrogenase (quinone) [Advenella kashmirensis WT001]|uniref:FMN dependent NADH:quinone oxidoreductase n=1 Tax=Advenella kashmirensis (strain DSM 17095 / LMG 22695 / WT001) TaxID=1036672 RepID=I3UHV5_ADVKW|nr:NAD(P)H-dependent oxidoreductase [Advenella kashmirensis]AFK64593.1 NAD(P)H dehydrogenase (quinone) [Advenella kashmirensis WT001]
MKLLHLTFSPRGEESESTRLSQAIVDRLCSQHSISSIVRRDWRLHASSAIDADYANALANAARNYADTLSYEGSLEQSERLICELEEADMVVIGTPMHNFTVPASLKTWIDLVVRVNRSFNITPAGKVGTLDSKPVYIAIASGGFFGSEHSRQPDFLTPYLKAILATIGLHDLRFFSAQGMALDGDTVKAGRLAAVNRVTENVFMSAL